MVAKKQKAEVQQVIEPPSSWKCPRCSNTVTVHVILEYVPWCQSKRHSLVMVDMERTDKPA